MSRIGLSEEQLRAGERARDAAMIDLLVASEDDRLEPAQVLSLNKLRAVVALGHPLLPAKRAWVEGLVARLGLSRDVGPAEDYAPRSSRPSTRAIDEQFAMGPKFLDGPRPRRRET